MANEKAFSTKQQEIEKLHRLTLVIMGVASFLVIFSLVTAKTLLSDFGYQGRVIAAKKTAVSQLKTDAGNVSQLVDAYKGFVNTPLNLLGGSSTGNNMNDGDNATVVLDALPSVYDFPGFASGMQNYFHGQHYTINSLSGTDDQINQQNQQPSMKSQPSQIPFSVSATGSYPDILSFILRLQRSIRPIQVQTLSLSGSNAGLTADVSAVTYYQPGVSFQIGQETIK